MKSNKAMILAVMYAILAIAWRSLKKLEPTYDSKWPAPNVSGFLAQGKATFLQTLSVQQLYFNRLNWIECNVKS